MATSDERVFWSSALRADNPENPNLRTCPQCHRRLRLDIAPDLVHASDTRGLGHDPNCRLLAQWLVLLGQGASTDPEPGGGTEPWTFDRTDVTIDDASLRDMSFA